MEIPSLTHETQEVHQVVLDLEIQLAEETQTSWEEICEVNCDPTKEVLYAMSGFAWDTSPLRYLQEISFVAMKMSPRLHKIIISTNLLNTKHGWHV